MEMNYRALRVCAETVDLFAFTNGAILKGTPRGILLQFHGLNFTQLRNECNEFEIRCAEAGILTVFPYCGPWSWMNMHTVRFVDRLVEVLKEKYGLGGVPVVASGGSMGGLASLIYTRYAAVTPDACFANCPVCDLPYHATERPDLPRTLYHAYGDYECGLEAALRLHSPYHQAAEMPDVPYFVVHGDADKSVNKGYHSDRFISAMREAGRRIEYYEVAGMAHCDLASFPEARAAYEDGILACFD